MISLRHIYKQYGTHRVLEDVNLTIQEGEIYGLIGKNGAGKTTIFKIILGLTEYEKGQLSIAGSKSKSALSASRKKIGFFIGKNFFDYLTARENLEYYRQMKGIQKKEEVDRVLSLVGLQDVTAKFSSFSMGMKQRLGIANAMLGNPEILILDEPVNGLDPQGIVEVRELLLRLNRERGLTVLVSSHILGELSRLAGRFGFIERGRLLREISAAELEEACGRRLVLHMNGIVRFGEAMEKLGIRKFRAVSPTVCEVETDLSVSALAFALREVGLEILRVAEKEADLEGYFMRLIGGEEV